MLRLFKIVSPTGLLKKVALPVCALAIALALMAGTPAYAVSTLTINPTFTADVDTQFGVNAAAFKSAFTTAANAIASLYTDPINVNITVTAVAGTGTLGGSSTPIFSTAFTTLRDALFTDRKSADDNTTTGAGGSVSSTLLDPIGGSHGYWVTRAQRKALGLAADDLTLDGTVTIGAGFTYDYDQSNGISAGAFDLVAVFQHEISEVMGRIGISGGAVNNVTSYTLLDLMAYTGAGTRGVNFVANDFFSMDNGTTLLKQFNSVAGGDSRDWASGTPDSFNAFTGTGVLNPLTPVDVRVVDALGYDLKGAATVPEPTSLVLIGSAILLGSIFSRRRK